MPRNVEIKARVSDIEKLRATAVNIANNEGTTIIQEDTFYSVPNGRLKLREIKDGDSMLIQYNRADTEDPKLSDFHIAEVKDSASMKNVLSLALGVKGVVKKTRNLILIGQTRVHIDDVDDLGHFMELEVMLKEGQTVEEGQQIAEDLMQKLNIPKENLLTGAYMDMLLKDI